MRTRRVIIFPYDKSWKSHPEAVKQYSRVKETAAALYPDDIDGYIQYKSPCIEELYKMSYLK